MLGQRPDAIAECRDIPTTLAAAVAALELDRIPSGSIALHNAGVAIAP